MVHTQFKKEEEEETWFDYFYLPFARIKLEIDLIKQTFPDP